MKEFMAILPQALLFFLKKVLAILGEVRYYNKR